MSRISRHHRVHPSLVRPLAERPDDAVGPDCPLARQPRHEVDGVGAEEVQDAAAHGVVAQPRVPLPHEAAGVDPHVAVVDPGWQLKRKKLAGVLA